ncbi:MAG: hypothetical protein ACC633_02950 [Anaerolineales bacterium]
MDIYKLQTCPWCALVYSEENTASDYPYQYTLGDSLLVTPIVEPDLKNGEVYLPEGEWY